MHLELFLQAAVHALHVTIQTTQAILPGVCHWRGRCHK